MWVGCGIKMYQRSGGFCIRGFLVGVLLDLFQCFFLGRCIGSTHRDGVGIGSDGQHFMAHGI